MGQAPPSKTLNQPASPKSLDQQPPSKVLSQRLTPKSLNQPPPRKLLSQPSQSKSSNPLPAAKISHQPPPPKSLNRPPPPPSTNTSQKPPILQIPPERERNFRRKPGFDYLLVTIEFQKGKKFGLGMVDTENRVLVNKVDDGNLNDMDF
ncbi:hypothetical protein ANCDUO_20701 [Ancylostoma duodenale]|uniref:PDZ domain-containing protein n=1 Tax=Ancylostoma duodenale TaxID=51022 RepID=A0A0C2FKW5_9BILA|nr:hypothetical protein ANCDUO_20701 [Ancylostoma duodenale]